MSEHIFIISPRRFQKRDIERFGVKYLKKKKRVTMLDVSNLINNRSSLFYKKIRNINIKEIKSYKELINFFKNKESSYAIDYSGYSIKEIIIKLLLVWFDIKIIRYLGGLKPPILYKHVDQNNKIFKVDHRTAQKKLFDIPYVIFTFLKKKIITLINFVSINIVMITGKNPQNVDYYINTAKKKIYSHTYDYNIYLELNKKKTFKKKKYIVYIDQNLSSHPDFYINKKNPFVNKNFYKKIDRFLLELKKKYKLNIKIALHPKNNLNKNFFLNKKNCYIFKTVELIKDSEHILMHYSTAVSFGVLYKKPITFITSDELNDVRPGAQITKLAKELSSQLINIDSYKKNFIMRKSFDKKKYINYKNQYIKHPKSSGENSWKYLLKNIY